MLSLVLRLVYTCIQVYTQVRVVLKKDKSHDPSRSYYERLARIEAKLESVEQDIKELKKTVDYLDKKVEKIDVLEAKLDIIAKSMNKRNNYMKFTIVLLGIILSFVAAMFGLGWRPP